MILTFVLGCVADPRPGTFVGNPGDADAQASRVDPRIVLDRVDIPVDRLEVTDCSGDVGVIEVGRTIDGLVASELPIVVPGGRYCAMELVLDGPVVASGQAEGGTAFTVELDLGGIAADGRVEVDGQHLLFEVPLPIDPEVFEGLGTEVTVPADDPDAVRWAAESVLGVALWEDANRDGLLSGADVLIELGGSGVFPALAGSGDAGCGCATDSTKGAWLGALCVVILRRRRERPWQHGRRCPGERST